MKKQLFLFALIVLMSVNSLAVNYILSGHSIDVFVSKTNNLRVRERYYLKMNSLQLIDFRQETAKLGNDLKAWQEFDERFSVSLASLEELKPRSATISLNESNDIYVELAYFLDKPIFNKKNETSRLIEYSLSKESMRKYISAPFFIIPSNTVITFIFPLNVTIEKDNMQPEAIISSDQENTYVSWQGYKKVSALNLNYIKWKEIKPVSIARILESFIEDKSPQKILVIALIVILGVFALYNKEKITKGLFSFMEKNSELK